MSPSREIDTYWMISLPIAAMTAEVYHEGLPWLSNSTLVALIVTGLVVLVCRRATADMKLVPEGSQNLLEALVGGLYDMLEGVVGKHMIPKVFSLLATIFIFILTANWFGLVPGVGTIGFAEEKTGFLSAQVIDLPLFRPASADLNMTLAIAAVFMVLWLYWTVREIGAGGFILHLFAPKGGLKGVLAFALLPIFIFVGFIEIISIAFRPVSLSLRLFGNVYAGETLLLTMSTLGDSLPQPFAWLLGVVLPFPFYFLELLIGLVQALVFMLLCAVYISLSTSHDEEEGH